MTTPGPGDVGPPWARVTRAPIGYFITHGTTTLSITESTWGGEYRWWRPTRASADHKAQRLVVAALASRVRA